MIKCSVGQLLSLACPYDPKGFPFKAFSEYCMYHNRLLKQYQIINEYLFQSDELIRQVTIGCIEQGLLLYRIRNEIWHTIDCFKKVYESGVIFGLNKAIRAELTLNAHCTKVRIRLTLSLKRPIFSLYNLIDRQYHLRVHSIVG